MAVKNDPIEGRNRLDWQREPSGQVKFDLTINVPTLVTALGLIVSMIIGLTRANDKIDAYGVTSQQNQAMLSQLTANVNQLTTNTAVVVEATNQNTKRLDRIEDKVK